MNYQNLNILVVDDSEFFRNQIRGLLQAEGITSKDDAHDAKEALLKIQSSDFNLLLVDMVMPNMNGIQLIKEIRKTSKVKIIAMSTLELDHIQVDAINAGADDFIKKPLDPKELIASIKFLTGDNE